MEKELLARIADSLDAGEPDLTVVLTREALDAGIEPLVIIDSGLILGMKIVGEKFSVGTYFLPHLIIAAKGMKAAMELLEPALREKQQERESLGKVVIGTVAGDIHEIGKSLVGTMLSANGFEVYDLGVDVPVETFIQEVKSRRADLLGLSALLTTTRGVQRSVIEALEAEGLRDGVKVLVGGAPVTLAWAREIQADGYAEDAMGAVALAKSLLHPSG
jgi:corrinoid protein of di/trimethylamine methyltransferase